MPLNDTEGPLAAITDRAGDEVSKPKRRRQCFIDFIKDGPGASASSGAERADEPVDEHADAR
jgi:hypothetical protein